MDVPSAVCKLSFCQPATPETVESWAVWLTDVEIPRFRFTPPKN